MTVLHTIIIELLDFQSGMLIGHAEDLPPLSPVMVRFYFWFRVYVAIWGFNLGYGVVSSRMPSKNSGDEVSNSRYQEPFFFFFRISLLPVTLTSR